MISATKQLKPRPREGPGLPQGNTASSRRQSGLALRPSEGQSQGWNQRWGCTGSGAKPDHGFCFSHILRRFVLQWAGFLSDQPGGEKRNSCLAILGSQTARTFDIPELQKCWLETSGSPMDEETEAQGRKDCPSECSLHIF